MMSDVAAQLSDASDCPATLTRYRACGGNLHGRQHSAGLLTCPCASCRSRRSIAPVMRAVQRRRLPCRVASGHKLNSRSSAPLGHTARARGDEILIRAALRCESPLLSAIALRLHSLPSFLASCGPRHLCGRARRCWAWRSGKGTPTRVALQRRCLAPPALARRLGACRPPAACEHGPAVFPTPCHPCCNVQIV